MIVDNTVVSHCSVEHSELNPECCHKMEMFWVHLCKYLHLKPVAEWLKGLYTSSPFECSVCAYVGANMQIHFLACVIQE